MNLQIGPGAVDLTLIDEHGNTVCTFAVCDEDARQVARKMCAAFNYHDEAVKALKKAAGPCDFDPLNPCSLSNDPDKHWGEGKSCGPCHASVLVATLAKVQP